MGLFNKKEVVSNENKEIIKREPPSWSYSKGNRALKILTLENIKTGEITFPKVLINFFDLNGAKIDKSQEIKINFLRGEYTFELKLIEKTRGYIKFEEDFRETLVGVLHSINRDKGGGQVYIDFIKLYKNTFNVKVGVAKTTEKQSG